MDRWAKVFTLGAVAYFSCQVLTTLEAIAQQHQSSGWIADTQGGCRVWNQAPEVEDSIKWVGLCINGFAHGRGTLRWFSKGVHYETDEGEFRNGKLNGFAILTFTTGRRFEGQWRDQKPNGQGTLRTELGEIYSGIWHDGCFRRGSRRATQNATKEECGFN